MTNRWKRIRTEFGLGTFWRTMLLQIGWLGMASWAVYFERYDIPVMALAVTVLAFFLREQIPSISSVYQKLSGPALFIYGIVLIVGDWLGISIGWKLFIITFLTVVMFNLQFYIYSHPDTYNIENE